MEGDELLEVKAISSLTKSFSLGRGTAKNGGNYAAVGHKFAFGNTEEKMLKMILGVDTRGRPTDRPFDHTTGKGYVAEHRGHYYDALKVKKLKVYPLITESLGGIATDGRALLRRLERMSDTVAGDGRDSTPYTCWTAPSFTAHHGMCVSAACVYADATLLAEGARRAKAKLASA